MKRQIKKITLLIIAILGISSASAQTCNVQGIVQYFYNDYIGFRPDLGAEVLFIKYSSANKAPNIKKWNAYQDLFDKYFIYREYMAWHSEAESSKVSGFKKEYIDSLQTLGLELLEETLIYEDKNMIKYSTIVDASGKYSINIPYGTYYVLIKSKNRQFQTALEAINRQRMFRVVLNSPTKIINYDFDIPR